MTVTTSITYTVSYRRNDTLNAAAERTSGRPKNTVPMRTKVWPGSTTAKHWKYTKPKAIYISVCCFFFFIHFSHFLRRFEMSAASAWHIRVLCGWNCAKASHLKWKVSLAFAKAPFRSNVMMMVFGTAIAYVSIRRPLMRLRFLSFTSLGPLRESQWRCKRNRNECANTAKVVIEKKSREN